MDTHDVLLDVFARWAVRDRVPGIAWGLIRDGELVDHDGLGTLRVGEEAPPDPDSVFRIASMTKSFSGAALMSLVVEGVLGLDDPVARHVPELASWRGPTADGPPLTIRHLASMEAGLPTDDAWADRHLDLPPEGLDALIGTGASFAHTPGVAFEYSNLGWGLLGRVIERAAGVPAQRLVVDRLLEPLGMTSTTWTRPAIGAVAEPYRWEEEAWRSELEPLGDGTIAPMGGLWTTVRDLARWVGFLQDAWPPRDDPDDGPLPRWARREMQQARRIDRVETVRPRPDGPSRVVASCYGIGLGVTHDPRLGIVVGHSGGLPGYGSHMRWLPDRGIGIVALGNVTYARMTAACAEAIDVMADRDLLGPPRTVSAPLLEAAASRAASLLTDWSDEAAAGLFADNAAPDRSFARRAEEAARIAPGSGGVVRVSDDDPPAAALAVESLEVETPMRGTFVTAGGRAKVELELNHAGDVQWLDVEDRERPSDAPILDAPAALRDAAGCAYVILRPTGDLAEAFTTWQEALLDRLAGAPLVAPAAHATLKAFGSAREPVGRDDEPRIIEAVAAWAAGTAPIELRAEGFEVFEGDGWIPVVRLAPIPVLATLWAAASAAGLPAGSSDAIGADGWIPHLSLAYPGDLDDARRDEIVAWARHVDADGVSSVAREAELLAFDGGPARRLGRFVLAG